MKKLNILILAISILLLTGCADVLSQIQKSGVLRTAEKGLSADEIIKGLKEALVVGAENSTLLTSKKNGFYKNALIVIPFPEEAKKVKRTVEKLGMKSLIKDFEKSMNRAAEEASKKAFPIFKAAVMDMTISDGMKILKGANNAATKYLESKTRSALADEFTPVVKKAVDAVEVTSYWTPIVEAYNTTTLFTGEKAVNPNLDEYITDKTLDGLFTLIADEELKIRKNPVARVTDILKKVFGSL